MPLFVVLLLLHGVHSSISPQQLQQELNSAISNTSIESYTIPSGDYHFINTDFVIENANDFTIISTSKSIFYFNCSHGVSITNGNNVSITDVYIDFDPPCFSQGIINNYNGSEPSIIVTIYDGYPVPDASINPFFNSWSVSVIYWNATTKQMIHNQNWDTMTKSIALNNSPPYKYKIYLEWIADVIPKPGNLVTLCPRVQHTFICTNCSNMTFTNLTLYAAAHFAVLEQFGYGNNTYNNYQLRRRPNSNNLITSNADGFQSSSNVHGPILMNSYLEYTGDDFVNIRNRMNILLEKIDDYSLYIIDTLNGITLKNVAKNDYIYFYELNTQNYTGYGIVKQCIKQNNQTLINEAKASYQTLQNAPYNAGFYEDYSNDVVVYLVIFKNKLTMDITEYNLVEYDLGNGAVIKNNHFHSGYCAIMKLKSKYSMATNNIFEYAQRGVLLLAEQSWLEGEMGLTNIVIQNNVFKGCGTNSSAITVQSNAINITLYNNTMIP